MTAPGIDYYKFYLIKPSAGENLVLNPQPYLSTGYFSSYGTTDIAVDDTYTRRGPACLKMDPVASTECFVATWGLDFTSGTSYTFSADVLATAGVGLTMYFATTDGVRRATKKVTATGYWQRPEFTYSSTSTAEYWAGIQRDSTTNTDSVWMDGWQVEASTSASSFIYGYERGLGYIKDQREYWWTGYPYNSTSKRSGLTRHGGELVDIDTYAAVLGVYGLGLGTFEQIMTPMVSGGALYQKHIRKPRQFSLRLQYTGTGLDDIQAKRKAILDIVRPDNTPYDQPLVVRYQGFDVNGNEATHPVDIVCVLQNCHTDPPNSPTHQDDILTFTVLDGHLQGAYWEGKQLDLYADFPAEFIVKRDPDGNWCEPTTDGSYASLITGLNGTVYCMAEAPDGKIYAGGSFTDAGGTTDADKLARWDPINERWEKVVAGINNVVYALAFDANGDLYMGGAFTGLGSTDGNRIVKITDVDSTPTINALGTGLNGICYGIEISASGYVYAGGAFSLAGGVAGTAYIAYWYPAGSANWLPLSTGLNNSVYALAFAPDGNLWIGGGFTNASTDSEGDYLCYWDGSKFNPYWQLSSGDSGTEINNTVRAIVFDNSGKLLIGGEFTNVDGNADADYLARFTGNQWEAIGSGVNGVVYDIAVGTNEIYVSGAFTSAGGLTLTDRVAMYKNGAWQPLDIELPGNVNVASFLQANDNSLYIGGPFSSASSSDNAETGMVAVNLNVTSASANVYPSITVKGPGTLRSIVNYSTGRTITFDGLTLQTGEDILLYLDPTNLKMTSTWSGRGSVWRYVNAGSDFGDFYLRPGENLISLFMPSTDSASGGCIKWKPKFWSIDGAVYE